MAMTINIQKIFDAVEEGNCIFCQYVKISFIVLPDGSPQQVIECATDNPMDCYVVKSEVERLTP
jgi:hypothetical protein